MITALADSDPEDSDNASDDEDCDTESQSDDEILSTAVSDSAKRKNNKGVNKKLLVPNILKCSLLIFYSKRLLL